MLGRVVQICSVGVYEVFDQDGCVGPRFVFGLTEQNSPNGGIAEDHLGGEDGLLVLEVLFVEGYVATDPGFRGYFGGVLGAPERVFLKQVFGGSSASYL